jgi:DNA transposition AAA+ family ATPase
MSDTDATVVPIERPRNRPRDRVRERALELMEELGMSQGDLAGETGLSRSVVSQYLAGKYDHDGDADAAIEAWIVTAQGGVEALHFVETKNTRLVWEACKFAIEERRIVLVVSRPGLGKTIALNEFQRRAFGAREEVLNYHVAPTITPGSLARVMAKRFEITTSATTHDTIEMIVDRLKRKPATLLFDEANRLRVPSLEVIRYIHDRRRVPVVLVGSMELVRTLMDASGRYRELEQLQSRIALKVQLSPMHLEETTKYLEHHFQDLVSEVARCFHDVCKGIFRDLANAVYLVKRILKKSRLPTPTPDIVRAAFDYQVKG